MKYLVLYRELVLGYNSVLKAQVPFLRKETMKRLLVLLLCGLIVLPVLPVFGKGGSSSGSSRSSSSRSSGSYSSKPSSSYSSKPSSSGGSSKPNYSKPSSSGGSSKPNYSKPSSSGGSSKPNYSKPSSSGSSSKPNYSKPSSSPSVRPGSSPNTNSKPSVKPNSGGSSLPGKPSGRSFDSAAASDQKKAESKSKFQNANPAYKTPNGEKRIDPNSHSSKEVRNLPREKVENHKVIVEKHYYHHYGPRYDYYRSQPYIYVGGGYSSLFWYAMLDWDINRRAYWLYHHQNEVDAQLYRQQLQNADLRNRIAQLERQGVTRDLNYVDKDFAEDPAAMYDTEFVRANNDSTEEGGMVALWVFLGIVGAVLVCGLLYWFIFVKRWGE
jgi:hypothetical protein